MSPVVIERVQGEAIERHLPALAALRIAVFREFPYLYAGTLDYERGYLAHYAASPAALVVLARDGERVVGAATAMPLVAHSDDVVPPLAAAGYDPARVCYFGESVLERAYRGRGLGSAFFVERDAHARAHGFATAAFCAVVRPADHPRRPAGYRPLDPLWARHGFVRRPDITTTFSWRDLDDTAESAKPMVFWIKELA
ncbi:MAG TPA: GNAT family N-acetyltransferase [Kofleriaceae bacterium]|nr:GNAT family N-acetyltransferase [Kofleriaceae bacterium]